MYRTAFKLALSGIAASALSMSVVSTVVAAPPPSTPIAPPVPEAVALPASLGFGTQKVAVTSLPASVTVFDVGSGALSIGRASLAGADARDFSIVENGCSGQTLAATSGFYPGGGYPGGGSYPGGAYPGWYPSGVYPGEGCGIAVEFRPLAVGARRATLVVSSNDPSGPLNIALSGAGTVFVPPPPKPSTLSIPAQVDSASSTGETSVTLLCTGATRCIGTLALAHSARVTDPRTRRTTTLTTTIASNFFAINPGSSRLTLRLTSTGRSLLAANPKGLTVAADARYAYGNRVLGVTRDITLDPAKPSPKR